MVILNISLLTHSLHTLMVLLNIVHLLSCISRFRFIDRKYIVHTVYNYIVITDSGPSPNTTCTMKYHSSLLNKVNI